MAESDKGFLVSNIDLTPLCSPKFRSGQQNDEAQMLTSTFDDLVKNSQWLDLKQLCIAKEKLVWVLYCDITCLDYDGSILDASVVAFDAAMKTRESQHALNSFEYILKLIFLQSLCQRLNSIRKQEITMSTKPHEIH